MSEAKLPVIGITRPRDLARFTRKISIGPTGCWEWTGTKFPNGYGQFSMKIGERRFAGFLAHRLAYATTFGGIPDGMVIDHLCRNKACVNPRHLEAVTKWENTRRGNGYTARAAAQTTCKRGHELVWVTSGGRTRRKCPTCNRLRQRLDRAERKDAA